MPYQGARTASPGTAATCIPPRPPPLDRVKGAFGRSKGRDPFAKVFDSVPHGATQGSEKATKRITTHITETVPDRGKANSRLHKHNDLGVRDKAAAGKHGDGDGGHGPPGSGGRPGPGERPKQSREQPSRQARVLVDKFTCGDPIDMATGQTVLAQTDADLPGILPLTLHRTRLSGCTRGIGFGPSWNSSLDGRLEQDPEADGVRWRREDGSSLSYARIPDTVGDRVEPVAGERLPLTYVSQGTSYTLVVQDRGPSSRRCGSPYRGGPVPASRATGCTGRPAGSASGAQRARGASRRCSRGRSSSRAGELSQICSRQRAWPARP
ncbi:DUF6531 domain-containing protein [Streptomyces sp. NPDC003401]